MITGRNHGSGVIIVTFLLAHFTRFGYTSLETHYLIALLVVILVASVVLPATGAFRQEFEWAMLRRLRRLIAGWAIIVLVLVSIAAMTLPISITLPPPIQISISHFSFRASLIPERACSVVGSPITENRI